MHSPVTKLCISIAERPSTVGTTLFNAAFRVAKIPMVYAPCRVDARHLRPAISGVRVLGIRGCSVSMPHKQRVLRYLDSLDDEARQIGAVNTIVNDTGVLAGYNTDVDGAAAALSSIAHLPEKRIVLLGSGGAAAAIAAALHRAGAHNVIIVSLIPRIARRLVAHWGFENSFSWSHRDVLDGDVLINATPVGMSPRHTEMPVTRRVLRRFPTVFDVVLSPFESKLIRTARQQGSVAIPGHVMTFHRAVRQFELYTGQQAPLRTMQYHLRQLLQTKQ